MNPGKRPKPSTPPLTIQLLREGIVESWHTCQAVVVDSKGRVLSLAGSAETSTFARSTLKPIQAIPLITSGALGRWQLNEADLAIACSSHQGTVEQSRQVFRILWQCDVDSSALQCPIPPNKSSPLQHNCSGKHAAMIAICQQQGWEIGSYMDRNHPVQQMILQTMAEMLHMPPAEFISAKDDCGVPTYLLEIVQLAHLYAQLAGGETYRLPLECVVRSMTQYPHLIAGAGKFDTELMRLSHGALISKSGAEGVQCIGKVGEGLAVALKVADGSERARHVAAIHLLRQLGWLSPTNAEKLAETFAVPSRHTRLEVIGEI
jgi:L-asparaginase